MSHTRRAWSVVTAVAAGTFVAACGTAPSGGREESVASAAAGGVVSHGERAAPDDGSTPPSGAHVDWYGGFVIQTVQIVSVYWNPTVPYQDHLNAFYSSIANSPYIDWLSEYDTSTLRTQHIHRGTLLETFVDDTAPTSRTVTDSDIQQELTKLIDWQVIPNGDQVLYMVHFPAGITVDGGSGVGLSCKDFCGYHDSFTVWEHNAYYAVLPELVGGCAGACGSNRAVEDNETEVASHELIEAITDPVPSFPGAAWVDIYHAPGEIADLCQGHSSIIDGYPVSKGWSDRRGDCVATGLYKTTLPVRPVDFDGDGKADLSLKDPNGDWYIDLSANGFGGPQWDAIYGGYGSDTAIAVPADYDGDHLADLSVKDATGVWSIDYAKNGFGGWDVQYGGYGDNSGVPTPADLDGDGKADFVIKGSNGVYYIDYARNGFGTWDETHAGYGGSWSIPTIADYDGDRVADLSVKDSSGVWSIDYAKNGFGAWDAQYAGYGDNSGQPVPADLDGDGKADFVIKGSNGVFYIDYARNGFGSWDETHAGYGGSGSTAVPADYDGDHKADLSVKDTTGTWYVDYENNGFGSWNLTVDVYGR